MSENENLIQYYKDLLIIQYNDKPKAVATVDAVVRSSMIFDVAAQVRDGYDIETAVGAQQDVLGKYLGAPRVITGTTFTRNYFGLSEYGDVSPFDFYPMLKYGDEAPDAQFRNYTESTQSLFALTDEEYRIIQKLAVIRNNSNASVKDIDDILFQLFGAECYFIDRMNMTVVSYMVGVKWSRLFNIAKTSGLLPNPAGVGTGLIVVPDINNIFAFSLYGGDAPTFAVGLAKYAYIDTLTSIGGASRKWTGITVDRDGNLWAGELNGDIYKCQKGTTLFVAIEGTARAWTDIAVDLDGNLWATVMGGDIYKCNYGSTSFNAIGGTVRQWSSITSDSDGNLWATVFLGDIYKCLPGSSSFDAIGGTSRYWNAIAADSEGHMWAAEIAGDIYKCLNGSTTFAPIGGTSRNWYGLTSDSEGHMWATVSPGDIYKCQKGTTDFVSIGGTSRNWYGITVDSEKNLWASVFNGDIYEGSYIKDVNGCMAKYPE